MLQNLGKVDRTADEIFDEHLVNFNRQQTNANRLQKEFNNYIRCIRGKLSSIRLVPNMSINRTDLCYPLAAVQASSKLLTEAISDVYEMPWTGAETLHAQITSIESLWADFSHKLGDQVLIPLNTYTAQFPEMKVSLSCIRIRILDLVWLTICLSVFKCRKKSRNAAANSSTTTVSAIRSRICRRTRTSDVTTSRWAHQKRCGRTTLWLLINRFVCRSVRTGDQGA